MWSVDEIDDLQRSVEGRCRFQSVFTSSHCSAHNVTRVMLKRPLRYSPPQRPFYT